MKYKKITLTYKGKKYPAKLFSRKDSFLVEFAPAVFVPEFLTFSLSFEKSKEE